MTKHSTPGPCTGLYTTHNTLVVIKYKYLHLYIHITTGIQGVKNDCFNDGSLIKRRLRHSVPTIHPCRAEADHSAMDFIAVNYPSQQPGQPAILLPILIFCFLRFYLPFKFV